jgi:acyl-CoA thioester hydrolase
MTPPPDSVHRLLTELTFTAQSYDVDFMGIVSNIVYVRWLEDLRLELLARYHPLNHQLARGYTPILARTEIVYKHPVQLGEPVCGRMWVSDLARARWTVSAELHGPQHLAASATQVGYFWNLDARRPIPVPEELVRQYESWLDEPPPADDNI